jgi:hypothetical protein
LLSHSRQPIAVVIAIDHEALCCPSAAALTVVISRLKKPRKKG